MIFSHKNLLRGVFTIKGEIYALSTYFNRYTFGFFDK